MPKEMTLNIEKRENMKVQFNCNSHDDINQR
jgi:hypothetical protein